MSSEPVIKSKGLFGKISKALGGSQSAKSISEAKSNESSPRNSGLITPSKIASSLPSITRNESARNSNELISVAQEFTKSQDKSEIDPREILKYKAAALNDRANSINETEARASIAANPQKSNRGNAAFTHLQQAAKKDTESAKSQSLDLAPKVFAETNAISTTNTDQISQFKPHSSTRESSESRSSTTPPPFDYSTKESKDFIDIDNNLQKRKDSSSSQSTSHPLSNSTKPTAPTRNTPESKATEALLAQLRHNASLKIASSSQQTMVDLRSASGSTMSATGEINGTPGLIASKSIIASFAYNNGAMGIIKRETSSTTTSGRSSRTNTVQYKQNNISGALEESDFEAPKFHSRGRANTSNGLVINTQAVKSPFGGAQVAAQQMTGSSALSPFQNSSGAPKARAKNTNGSLRKQIGEEEKNGDEKSNFKVKPLKTMYAGTDENAVEEDYGFDQDSVFAVKGNVHLVHCFSYEYSPFTLNPGWEIEAFSDTRYNVWRRVVFETIPAQRDLPLLLPEDLFEYLEN